MNGADVTGVEIGVNAAEMSRHMLSLNSRLKLFGIDPYLEADRDGSYFKSGDWIARNRSQGEHDEMHRTALSAFGEYGDRAELLRMFSLEAAPLFDNASLDFVFIDGDHSYEGAHGDISAWAAKVKPGGWLCGHDYKNAEMPFPGVDRAVDEWIAETGRHLESDENYTWFVRMI